MNPHLSDWIEDEKKVIGYYCSSIPEEIIHAAGILALSSSRNGNDTYNLADSILSQFNCSFVKSTLNLIMQGKYDFMSGMVFANTCDHVRRIYDVYEHKLNLKSKNPYGIILLITYPMYSPIGAGIG